MNHEINAFTKGVHNLIEANNIPKDAAQDSSNFVTKEGKIILVGGRKAIGDEGAVGKITALHKGYKVDGSIILFRKAGTVIQYWTGSTWTDIITGLDENDEYYFDNYASLAGAFTIINGVGGIWKIVNANPTSPIAVYHSTQNFHGKILIDRGRTLLWDRVDNERKDKTGLYGSFIDRQNSTVYTTITNENIGSSGSTSYSGTLAFKGDITGTDRVFTVDTATDIVTATGHGYVTGDAVRVTSSGTLPAPLVAGTIYYVKKISGDTFYLYSDINLTQAINFTTTGSGTHTVIRNNARANCFGVTIQATVAAGLETFVDDYLGNLTSNLGGTGTINYATGAYSVTFSAVTTGAVTANYQWEDITIKGILDFTYSATRQAGQGFQFPQDVGGDAILNVLIGQDGAYYSLKKNSAYRLALDADDTNATNEVYRRNIGIPFWRCAVSVEKGIVFLNTSNPSKPELTILTKNPLGEVVEPIVLFPHFRFGNFTYDEAAIGTYDRWILLFCKSTGSIKNDTILMCSLLDNTVDIISYNGQMSVQDAGNLYVGDSVSKTVYQIFNGFDDMGLSLENYWISKDEDYNSMILKKIRRLRFTGTIGSGQYAEVYASYDNAGFQLVGTIRGNAEYVDYTSSHTIGANIIGESQVGGDDTTSIYDFEMEMKIRSPKFKQRAIKIIAKGLGYFDLSSIIDWDILTYENRLPKAYRQKQNVSIDGTLTNQ